MAVALSNDLIFKVEHHSSLVSIQDVRKKKRLQFGSITKLLKTIQNSNANCVNSSIHSYHLSLPVLCGAF